MSYRIGLFTDAKRRKKTGKSTSNIYVDVDTLKDLAAKLAELGAVEVGLLCRHRTGDTTLEGEMFPVAGLGEKHLKWLTDKPAEFQTRGLFYH